MVQQFLCNQLERDHQSMEFQFSGRKWNFQSSFADTQKEKNQNFYWRDKIDKPLLSTGWSSFWSIVFDDWLEAGGFNEFYDEFHRILECRV